MKKRLLISDIKLFFWEKNTNIATETIYANGHHQILIKAKIKVNICDIYLLSELKKCTKLVNFIDYDEVGKGVTEGWNYYRTPNAFLQKIEEFGGHNYKVKFEDYFDNDYAYLNFFVSTIIPNSALDIGLEIALNDNFSHQKPIRSAKDSEYNSKITVSSIPSIEFTPDNFLWTAQQGDQATKNIISPHPEIHDDDLWREFDYTVRLSKNRIFRCRIINFDVYHKSKYNFGENRCGFYKFSGYLWPNNFYNSDNIFDINGTTLVTGDYNTYEMNVDGAEGRTITIKNSPGYIYASLLCTFGSDYINGYEYNSLRIQVFDQYGNYGVLCVDPYLLPKIYIQKTEEDGLQKLKFFSTEISRSPEVIRTTDGVAILNKDVFGIYADAGDYRIVPVTTASVPTLPLFVTKFDITADKSASTDRYIAFGISTEFESPIYIQDDDTLATIINNKRNYFLAFPRWNNNKFLIRSLYSEKYLSLAYIKDKFYFAKIVLLDELYMNPDNWKPWMPIMISSATFEWQFVDQQTLLPQPSPSPHHGMRP